MSRRDWPASTAAAYPGLSSYASRSRLPPALPPDYALPPPSQPLPILGSAWSSSTPAPSRGVRAPFPTGSPELEQTFSAGYGRPVPQPSQLEQSYAASRSAYQHPASMISHGSTYAPAPALSSYATETSTYNPYGTVTSAPAYPRPSDPYGASSSRDPYGASSSHSRYAHPSPPAPSSSYRREVTPALSYTSTATPSYTSASTPGYTSQSPNDYRSDPTWGVPRPTLHDDDDPSQAWRRDPRYVYRESSYAAYEDD